MMPNRALPGYAGQTDQSEQLVTAHLDLVRRVAHHLMARLPASVQVEDLVQSGMIGLIEASRQFQCGQGATFATYASIRIRGAMIDELRRSDWTPRSVHRNSRRIAEAIRRVEAEFGRAARDSDIAAALEVSIAEYHAMLQDCASTRIFGWEDLFGEDADPDQLVAGSEPGPGAQFEQEQLRDALAHALGTLSEKERLVLALYYDEELNLREIGAVLGVTESRVSQIRSQTLHRLQARLIEWHHNGADSVSI
ncbi:RNA polymerase sigma factor FliA [Chromatium okenii]|uniref:RNA polymerase sigma factor FliA n=1 Tax=Chromatium okenii TaxID=61644 RepID=UPI0019038EB3|nr:RNA polymerase sigma factor FliA [Chromatium okenii]MBK1641865.1 RNA polymerase sigma factor FliA [Chromatium okenii]